MDYSAAFPSDPAGLKFSERRAVHLVFLTDFPTSYLLTLRMLPDSSLITSAPSKPGNYYAMRLLFSQSVLSLRSNRVRTMFFNLYDVIGPVVQPLEDMELTDSPKMIPVDCKCHRKWK